MKHVSLVTAICLLALSSPVWAADIAVSDAWARATPPSAKMGAAYLTIKNTGGKEDRLKSVAAEVAASPQIHTMTMDNGIMQMRELTEGLAIPAGGKAVLSPDGTHIMLIGLKQPLVEGQKIQLLLHFEKAGIIKAAADIKSIGYTGDKKDEGVGNPTLR